VSPSAVPRMPQREAGVKSVGDDGVAIADVRDLQ
jgi:hypothetical protein